jgi:hypothetical protein
MQRREETGKSRSAASARRNPSFPGRCLLLPLVFGLAPWMAGCAGDGRIKDDPLTGGAVPAPPAPAAAPAQAPATTAAPVPPLPVATSADSNASLAAGRPLPGGRELAINDPRESQVKNATWNEPGTAAAPASENKGTGASLQHPEPVGTPASRETLDPVQRMTVFDEANSGSVAGGSAYEELLKKLKERGMNWYQQETSGDGIKFLCTVPRKDTNRTRSFEAVAANELEAVKAIIEQIDNEP